MSFLRRVLRPFARARGFSATVVLTLAVGIGAVTAIFTLAQGLILRPLPIFEQDRVAMLREATRQNPSSSVAYPNFTDWRARQRTFVDLAAVRLHEVNVTRLRQAERVSGAMVSHAFFPVLGVPAVAGRLFSPGDDKPGAARTVVIRESLCRRHFETHAAALGQPLPLDGDVYTVIGVVSDAFVFPANATELWLPLGLWADAYRNRRHHPGLSVLGRLRPGTSFDAARADLAAIAADLEREYPDSNHGNGVALQPLTQYLFKDVGPVIRSLFVAVLCVLGIACANVAGLVLVRCLARRQEFALRVALGAGSGRVVAQVVLENLLVAATGALAGWVVSLWVVDAIKAALPATTPRLDQVNVDGWALVVSLMIAGVSAAGVGAFAGWRVARGDPVRFLGEGRTTTGRLRGSVVVIVAEFALMVMLLLGAGLMLRTLYELQRGRLGFVRDQVLTFGYDLPAYAFADGAARLAMESRILPRLAGLPGVQEVGYSSALPLSTRSSYNGFTVEGAPEPKPGDLPLADTANVSPRYFAALGIPLVRGRAFSDRDGPGSVRVAIVDTLFVARHFAGQDPLGRRLKIGDAASNLPWMEIVGVVAHIEKYGLGREAGPQLYRPARQAPGVPSYTFVLRGTADTARLAATVREVFRELSPAVPVYDIQTMDDRFHASIGLHHVTAVLLTAFAGLAAVLACVGLFALQSYVVAQRTREFGIRVALGASPGRLMRQVLGHGAMLSLAGTGLGLAASLGAARALRGLLYGVSPLDPLSFVAVPCIALLVALLACWMPARRAMGVNPVDALRSE